MSIIFDILACVIILCCAIASFKEGAMATFIKKVAPLFSLIAAASGAYSLGQHFKGLAIKIAPESEFLHGIIQVALGFVIIFILSMLILFIIRKLFTLINNLLNKIPGLNVVNKIINVVLGILIGYFNANFFVYVLSFVGIFVDAVESGLAETFVCKFIGDHSIFGFVIKLLADLFA